LPEPINIGNEDLPALFRQADRASIEVQKRYLRLVRWDLIALVVGAILSAFQVQNTEVARWLLVAGAVVLAIGFVLTLIISLKSYKDQWYGSRAAAESVKSLAWRYMARAKPFDNPENAQVADDALLSSLRDILNEQDNLSLSFGKGIGKMQSITDTMREVRGSDLSERKATYLKHRIDDQRIWYSTKSANSRTWQERFFYTVMGCQILALTSAIVLAVYPSLPLNPTGAVSAMAAAFLAWLQVKQHQEQAQSYAVASQELTLITSEARHVETEEEFSTFVADAEAAISREHTLWLARRDQLSHVARHLQTP